jgi:exopolysaccharide biosynthesis polyprenyl glycosylphosphotransferase
VPSYFSILVSGLYLDTLSGIPILGLSRLPLDRTFNKLVKRLLDIVGAALGMLLSVPLVAIFGALVYLESPGPILYRQRRIGRNGKIFDMLKIRSMRLDAEKDGEIGWSTKDDPRRLRIGAFMRKWNIDETPQFWNVLKGEMSLVGPRPERPELIQNFKHAIPHYHVRHTVKPGITGWAQVNGLRGDTDLSQRISHDLYYVEHWNLLFDLQTMVLTFFKNTNAS